MSAKNGFCEYREEEEEIASTGVCDTCRQLLEVFGASVKEVIRLHEEQFQALLEGDLMAHRFDILIHQANECKQNAKYAYMAHFEIHRGAPSL